MPLTQELRHLRASSVQTWQHREYRLLALAYLLIQHVVGLVELRQSRRSVDNGYGVDVVELVLAVVNHRAQLLGRTCGQKVDGVSHR